MNLENIKEIIISNIEMIAGIAGFRSITNDDDTKLDSRNIVIEESLEFPKILNVSIGLVLITNVSAKHIVEEIHQIITYELSKSEYVLGKLEIYIKGTK
ncbi:hypothetical protein [[Mycoplasma] anseris]|uniref:Asp23/Gls24 family envelope stress response protein n=1 Tax=[Mycoplasma] anseris TaxID=92400 RepID=A0A2Z4NCY3_9BACT|nr:hypothetical protein [[Mycoplasma] anseris]AWX69431.1 hypothetical protein DP065_01520 [[Mycoplasma] anseris]